MQPTARRAEVKAEPRNQPSVRKRQRVARHHARHSSPQKTQAAAAANTPLRARALLTPPVQNTSHPTRRCHRRRRGPPQARTRGVRTAVAAPCRTTAYPQPRCQNCHAPLLLCGAAASTSRGSCSCTRHGTQQAGGGAAWCVRARVHTPTRWWLAAPMRGICVSVGTMASPPTTIAPRSHRTHTPSIHSPCRSGARACTRPAAHMRTHTATKWGRACSKSTTKHAVAWATRPPHRLQSMGAKNTGGRHRHAARRDGGQPRKQTRTAPAGVLHRQALAHTRNHVQAYACTRALPG
jgi:hypothetical protein